MSSRVDQFAALVEKNPTNVMFRLSLSQALINEARGTEAIPHLQVCAESKDDWMMPRILLGKELLAAGRREDAKPWLEQALALAIDQDHEEPEAELRGILSSY